MRIRRLFMLFLFIAVAPISASAGQSADNETKGTSKEPECDYITVPEFI